MVWYRVLLLIFFLTSEHNAQRIVNNQMNRDIDTNTSEEMEILKREIDAIIEENQKIDLQQSEVLDEIEKLKLICDEEVLKLNNEQHALHNRLSENQKNMVKLLILIQGQEAEHAKLETKLKETLDVLHMFETQYEIVYYDMKLMDFRRKNGTAFRCNELSKSLKEELDEVMETRAYMVNPHKPRVTKLTSQEMKLRILKTEMRIKEMQRKKLVSSLESLNAQFNILSDECNARIINIKNLIIDTNNTMVQSTDSVKSMEDDLKAAIYFSDAVRVEIETAKDFIVELRQQILDMRLVTETYNDDEVCYKYIKSVD